MKAKKTAISIRKNGLPRNGRGEVEAKMDALGLEGICGRIEQGQSMTEIAESLGTDVSQLCRYLDRSEQAIQQSARAMRRSAEAWLDRGLRAVQDALDKKGNVDPSAARAYAQECARRAAVRNPAYRERAGVELTGANGGPMQSETVVTVYIPDNGRDPIEGYSSDSS